jgi:hypothetical protein
VRRKGGSPLDRVNLKKSLEDVVNVFSSLDKAVQEGFQWVEFQPSSNLHIVEKIFTRQDGMKFRAIAFARAAPARMVVVD